MCFKQVCYCFLALAATAVLSGVSCIDDWAYHPDHLVYGYTDSPWFLGTKAEFVAKGSSVDSYNTIQREYPTLKKLINLSGFT